MIVKNEASHLPECLESVKGLADEIIIVDTGSTDRTCEIARGFGAKVHSFAWVDDFSAARNEALRLAAGEWIFWLDADDRVEEGDLERIRTLMNIPDAKQVAFVMQCMSLVGDAPDSAPVQTSHIRLFPNIPNVRWTGRVHEQVDLRQSNCSVCWTDVVIRHVGYEEVSSFQQKRERNLRLLNLNYLLNPDDPDTLFYLGRAHLNGGHFEEAWPYFVRCAQRTGDSPARERKLYALQVQCLSKMGRKEDALRQTVWGLSYFPDDLELRFEQAVLYCELGRPLDAELCLRELLALSPSNYMRIGVSEEQIRMQARYLLGMALGDQGRLDEAEQLFLAALVVPCGRLPGLRGLGYIALLKRQSNRLTEIIRQLRDLPGGQVHAAVMEAEWYRMSGQFATARALLTEAIRQNPREMWPRLVLSEVLRQEGTDRQAFIEAQYDILALDPGNADARQRLQVLLAQSPPAPRPEPVKRPQLTEQDTVMAYTVVAAR